MESSNLSYQIAISAMHYIIGIHPYLLGMVRTRAILAKVLRQMLDHRGDSNLLSTMLLGLLVHIRPIILMTNS
jgi:hypothetical protein